MSFLEATKANERSTLAIDPGNDTGWCVSEKGIVVSCGVGVPPLGKFERVVIERPQIYRNSKAPPNDIITLAIGVGIYVERYSASSSITMVLPHDWKGTVPKPIHHARILAQLSGDELHVLGLTKVPASKRHNMLDAVGLAKWAHRHPITANT